MRVYKLKKKIRESEMIPLVLDLGSLKELKEDKQKKGNLPVIKEEFE
jgi:hypothetical protein